MKPQKRGEERATSRFPPLLLHSHSSEEEEEEEEAHRVRWAPFPPSVEPLETTKAGEAARKRKQPREEEEEEEEGVPRSPPSRLPLSRKVEEKAIRWRPRGHWRNVAGHSSTPR